jgi:dihydropteroate synthase
MGILNVTPDSFFADSRLADVNDLLTQAEKMLTAGADFLDVGGYSSRPGAEHITEQDELNRVVPAVTAIAQRFPDALISIDTFRAKVAHEALAAGAALVNDISAGAQDAAMLATVARHGAPYVCMHMRGTPQTMQQQTSYENVVYELIDFFQKKLVDCQQAGIKDVIIDPGFGFAKTVAQNFEILAQLEKFRVLQLPLLVGLSRKSMVWRTLQTDAAGALNGTTALHMVALQKGAAILRVHDVREARETITLFQGLQHASVHPEIV